MDLASLGYLPHDHSWRRTWIERAVDSFSSRDAIVRHRVARATPNRARSGDPSASRHIARSTDVVRHAAPLAYRGERSTLTLTSGSRRGATVFLSSTMRRTAPRRAENGGGGRAVRGGRRMTDRRRRARLVITGVRSCVMKPHRHPTPVPEHRRPSASTPGQSSPPRRRPLSTGVGGDGGDGSAGRRLHRAEVVARRDGPHLGERSLARPARFQTTLTKEATRAPP